MALQLNKSFLILDKEKSFCYKIYVIDQACLVMIAGYQPHSFLCVFKNLNFVSVHKKSQKRTWPISSHLDLTFG